MAARYGKGFEVSWRNEGMRFVGLRPGMATLAAVVAAQEPHAAVLPADWAQYGKFIARRQKGSQPLPRVLVNAALADAAAATAADGSALLKFTPATQEIMDAAKNKQATIMQATVIKVIQDMIEHEVEDWDLDKNVTDFGLTSSAITELANELSEVLGIDVAATVVYEGVNLRGISAKLLEDAKAECMSAGAEYSAGDDDDDDDDDGLQAAAGGRSLDDRIAGMLAVIGVGCRFAGNANDPVSFWKNLEARLDCVVEPPAHRPTNGRRSGYLSGATISEFDCMRFQISAREASVMDPQQRLLLEVTQHALEDAGVLYEQLAEREVGVYVGVSAVDYGALAMEQVQAKVAEPTAYSGTGWSISIAANRISYVYDFLGPSYSMDTACSSSLVCMNTAATAIKLGECHTAIVCGVNLQFRPVWSDAFTTAGMLSPSFKCKFGDDSADGYVRGEGCGAVIVKRKAAAVTDGNMIYGLVIGSAVNQDGHSAGLTAPTPAAQERLLASAYERFAKEDVLHIEAHGTGTRLGDPIELTALHCALRQHTDPDTPKLLLASVKSNIGHLECAAGIASLVKTALAMSRSLLMPSLHFKVPNSQFRWETSKLGVVSEPYDASAHSSELKIFGCSGFGFGGTNAHTVLQQYEREEATAGETGASDPAAAFVVVPLSSHIPQSVQATAEVFGACADTEWKEHGIQVQDISHRAANFQGHSSSRPARAAVVADSLKSLGDRMKTV
eukprot:SAG22_NODE_592_length_8810_cov_3.873264_3_plen_731_part_00